MKLHNTFDINCKVSLITQLFNVSYIISFYWCDYGSAQIYLSIFCAFILKNVAKGYNAPQFYTLSASGIVLHSQSLLTMAYTGLT